MEKEFGSWFRHQHSNWQSPNLNSLTAPLDLGQQNSIPGLPQPNEHHGWFHFLPRFRQAAFPVQNSIFEEKIAAGPYENRREAVTGSGCAQKRFLVFDQSGDQTTLIFSSGTPKLPGAYVLNMEEPGTKGDALHNYGPILTDEYNENVGSEMREDTEELNALLYSDDDYNSSSSENEEMSTGHSPSTMTAYDKQEWLENVASSAEPVKRRKLCDDVPSLMDTGAESSCGEGTNQGLGEFDSLSNDKRKDKMRETLSVLQSIIPGEKGNDAIVLLDKAIHYLRSLKRKAKDLGLDTI